ncbi:MAG: hypothetical protein IK134_01525 [Oscillospiraceae bacterium]|nr:hypothetical protein [Oscillospiraceae bacterium]
MNQETEQIGYYGQAWMSFMEENYAKLAAQLQKCGTYEEVARSVDRSACDYCDLLRKQYAQQNPPPDDPEAYRTWKYTRDYYINSTVMRERVLIAVTRV